VTLSVVTSALALVMFAPRLYVAMADDRVMAPALVGGQGDTMPVRGTLLLAVLASVLASLAGFDAILTYFMAPTLVFIALAAWTGVRAAAPVTGPVTGARGHHGRRGTFAALAASLAAGVFVVLLAGIIVLVVLNQPLQAGAGFVMTTIAAVVAFRERE